MSYGTHAAGDRRQTLAKHAEQHCSDIDKVAVLIEKLFSSSSR